MDLWLWIVVGVVAVLLLSAAVAFVYRGARRTGRRRRHEEELRERFGPEYERVVHDVGRKEAATALEERLSRYDGRDHPALAPADREAHTTAWRQAQFQFVDSPERAVREAEHLVVTVMEERHYMADDASGHADALSVDDAQLADAYRCAHRAFLMADEGTASVEQLLGAFLTYRELFEFLLARPRREDTVYDVAPPPARDGERPGQQEDEEQPVG